MKRIITLFLCISIMMLSSQILADNAKPEKLDKADGTKEGLIAKNLMNELLEITEGVEVVVSYVSVPPNTELPMHWHHGEEFIYVLEGSATIILKGKPDTQLKKGDVFKIPFKHIHTAKTGDEKASVIVFRVHEEGKPTRVNVE